MGGWMDGWMEAKAGLRIAYSNQKMKSPQKSEWPHSPRNQVSFMASILPGQNFDFSESSLAISLMFEGGDLLDGNLRFSFVVQSRPETDKKVQ